MRNDNITFSNALDSLNQIDAMMDDLLLNLQEWDNFQNKGRVIDSMLSDFKRNVKGDKYFYGLNEVAHFIVNESNKALNSRQYNVESLFDKILCIEEKNAKADKLIMSFPEMWNPSFPFLGTLSKLSFGVFNVASKIRFIKEGVGLTENGPHQVDKEKEQETIKGELSDNVPEGELSDNVPEDVLNAFGGEYLYLSSIKKLKKLKATKQIADYLMTNIYGILDYGNRKIVYEQFEKEGNC